MKTRLFTSVGIISWHFNTVRAGDMPTRFVAFFCPDGYGKPTKKYTFSDASLHEPCRYLVVSTPTACGLAHDDITVNGAAPSCPHHLSHSVNAPRSPGEALPSNPDPKLFKLEPWLDSRRTQQTKAEQRMENPGAPEMDCLRFA